MQRLVYDQVTTKRVSDKTLHWHPVLGSYRGRWWEAFKRDVPGDGISWRSLPWASGVPDRCGIFVGRYRPQIPRALGCQRGLALADLGCTVHHLGPTPANLIPPSSFAVSCDLKALWPGGLGCWGMGGRCTTWPINPPEVYTSFGPDPPGRQAAGCPCQSIGWRFCSQSLCADVGWTVCWHCLL